MVGVGGSDPMDFHALEAMQCMIERRRGGETGVQAGATHRGRRRLEGRRRRPLVVGAARIGPVPVRLPPGPDREGRPDPEPRRRGSDPQPGSQPAAYFIDYADGTRATLLMLNGALNDYNFAARVRGMTRSRLLPVPAAARPTSPTPPA